MDLEALDEVIKQNGDSHSACAKKLGITRATMCHRMSGKAPFRLDEVDKLIQLYGLNIGDVERIFFTRR